MLSPRDIVHLKLDKARLQQHQKMPLPCYIRKPSIGQFNVIGETLIGDLLSIDPAVFEAQLATARSFGISYLGENTRGRPLGVAACTSLVKTGDLITKNVVIPRSLLRPNPRLADTIIIGAFVHGNVDQNGVLETDGDIEVAGWIKASDALKYPDNKPPTTFKTKLPVKYLACGRLDPISTLANEFNIPVPVI